MTNALSVGDIITIPFLYGEEYDGVVLSVSKNCRDPRMKYEIAFDSHEPPLIMFYSEKMIRKIMDGKYKNNYKWDVLRLF